MLSARWSSGLGGYRGEGDPTPTLWKSPRMGKQTAAAGDREAPVLRSPEQEGMHLLVAISKHGASSQEAILGIPEDLGRCVTGCLPSHHPHYLRLGSLRSEHLKMRWAPGKQGIPTPLCPEGTHCLSVPPSQGGGPLHPFSPAANYFSLAPS